MWNGIGQKFSETSLLVMICSNAICVCVGKGSQHISAVSLYACIVNYMHVPTRNL